MLIIFLLYVPKRYFSDVNVGKLEESSRATLPFRCVCLWRHKNFTRETGRVACHPPPCGWQAGHSGQIVWITLWIWEKFLSQEWEKQVRPPKSSKYLTSSDFIWYESKYNSNSSSSWSRKVRTKIASLKPYPSRTRTGPRVTLVTTHTAICTCHNFETMEMIGRLKIKVCSDELVQ